MLNQELFSKVFNIKDLRVNIFSKVKEIHSECLNSKKTYRWSKVIEDAYLLIYFNYFEELKQLAETTTRSFGKSTNGKDILYHAARLGRYEVIEYLTSSSAFEAIKWNYPNALEVTPCTDNKDAFDRIFRKVDMKELEQTARFNPYRQIQQTVVCAASKSRIDIIDDILVALPRAVVGFDISIIDGAIQGGRLEVIQHYMDSKYIQVDLLTSDNLIDSSARYNQFEIFKYLYQHNIGAAVSSRSIEYATRVKGLEILKFLKDQNSDAFQIDSQTIDSAASSGSLEVLKWLHENSSQSCTSQAMNGAAGSGHLDVVKWLHENRTEGCTTGAMDMAACNGHLDVVMWLHENRTEGCTTQAMNHAARDNRLKVVKWLHGNRTEGCTTAAIDGALEHEHLNIAKWLHENRTEGCTVAAKENAEMNENKKIIKWLKDSNIKMQPRAPISFSGFGSSSGTSSGFSASSGPRFSASSTVSYAPSGLSGNSTPFVSSSGTSSGFSASSGPRFSASSTVSYAPSGLSGNSTPFGSSGTSSGFSASSGPRFSASSTSSSGTSTSSSGSSTSSSGSSTSSSGSSTSSSGSSKSSFPWDK